MRSTEAPPSAGLFVSGRSVQHHQLIRSTTGGTRPSNPGDRMYFHRTIVAVALCLIVAGVASAQSVSGSLSLGWVLPTTGCLVGTSPPVCNQPLTGTAALEAVHVWISTSPISDAPAGAPTLTLSAGATTATHTMQVTNGQTLYARVSVRNPSNSSALSNQVTRVVSIPVAPGIPTSVTINLTIGAP